MEYLPLPGHDDDDDVEQQLSQATAQRLTDSKADAAAAHAFLVVLSYAGAAFVFVMCFFLRFCDLPSEFSLQLSGVEGLYAAAPGAAISAVFNMTLHHHNRHFWDVCYRPGEAAVSYAGFTVAWGRTPGSCVGRKKAGETVVAASSDGVRLPEELGHRMAAESRVGVVELVVDLKLFRDDDGLTRPTWMSCKIGMASGKQQEATPCTVLSLQNWASESGLFDLSIFLPGFRNCWNILHFFYQKIMGGFWKCWNIFCFIYPKIKIVLLHAVRLIWPRVKELKTFLF